MSEPVEVAGPVRVSREDAVELVLITEELIQQRVRELGREITHAYRDLSPVIIGILKGSFVFLADLIRSIDIAVTMDFVTAQSYFADHSVGDVTVTSDCMTDIAGRHVLLVDDIVDTGQTLARLTEHLRGREPASLQLCTLLQKRSWVASRRELRYVGFRIPDVYVVGYGLDYKGKYRNLPYIGVYSGANS